MRVNPAVRLLVIIVCIFCSCRAYAQTGQFFDEFGASCKSIAMGQAFTAVADDFSAAYYNPAGLTQLKSVMELTMGYYYAKPKAKARIEWIPYRYDDDIPSEISGQRSSRGAILGVASNLDIAGLLEAYPWFKRFAFGMVFWVNLPIMLSYDTGPESYRPHFFRYDEGFSLMSMVSSMAFEVTPWFSVGAGFFLSQKTYSKQEVFSAINYSNYIPGFNPDEVIGSRLSIWSKAEAFVVPVLGILLKPPIKSLRDKIALGICWRGQNKTHFGRGPLIASLGLEMPDGKPFDLGLRDFINTKLSSIIAFQPEQATLALALKGWPFPVKGLTVSGDVTWKDYSKYVDYMDKRPDPPFEDTFVPRIGIEYAFEPRFSSKWVKWIRHIAVRGGYYREPSPVPSISKSHNIFDTDQDVLSSGFQFDFSSRQGRLQHSVETYFQAHLLRTRHISNEDDPFFGPATLSGHVLSYGISMTTKF